MPAFTHEDLSPRYSLIVNFLTAEAVDDFAKRMGLPATPRDGRQRQSLWYPPQDIGRLANKRYRSRRPPRIRYPVFIPSKGRAATATTMRLFDELGVPYTIFVEPQEAALYEDMHPAARIHRLPHRDQGLTVTRNYIWDYASQLRVRRFWTFDDNISGLYRFQGNFKVPVCDGSPLSILETFADRYTNATIVGMNYFMFVKRKYRIPPFKLNTRVYSNMLIETGAEENGRPLRNRLFFNDDTDLCIRALKAGLCTVLVNSFLVEKATTMTMGGGMTEFYRDTDRRREFVAELREAHPDCVRETEKWGRVHHQVDYSRFRTPLERRPGTEGAVDCEHDLVFEELRDGEWSAA